MKKILATCQADHWNNPEQVQQELATVQPSNLVVIECIEGFSIVHSGLLDLVLKWQQQTGHATELIKFRSVNHEDSIPFENIHAKDANGCWPSAQNYWTDNIEFINRPKKLFGFFVGRSSIARNVQLWECWNQWPDHFLFSKLKNATDAWTDSFETLEDWIESSEVDTIQQWFNDCPIGSIDNYQIKDQYNSSYNTNSSMLTFYTQFGVELVSETMVMGTTFFPTEKTVRPIVGLKPFVVFGPKNYLANLRQLGFKTFGDIWDESYDQLAGPARWKAIKAVIHYIINQPDIIDKCQEIVYHNKQVCKKKAAVYQPPRN